MSSRLKIRVAQSAVSGMVNWNESSNVNWAMRKPGKILKAKHDFLPSSHPARL